MGNIADVHAVPSAMVVGECHSNFIMMLFSVSGHFKDARSAFEDFGVQSTF